MDDDDEIQSHLSPATGSPASANNNSWITMMVVGPVPVPQPLPNSVTIVLLVQPRSNCNGKEDCWSEGAMTVLIDMWSERYLKLSRRNLKQKHRKKMVDMVSSRENYTETPKIDTQCRNQIDMVKKKQKLATLI